MTRQALIAFEDINNGRMSSNVDCFHYQAFNVHEYFVCAGVLLSQTIILAVSRVSEGKPRTGETEDHSPFPPNSHPSPLSNQATNCKLSNVRLRVNYGLHLPASQTP